MRALWVLLLVILAWGIGKTIYDSRSVKYPEPVAVKTESKTPPAADTPQTNAEPKPEQQPPTSAASVPAMSPATESSSTESSPPLDLSLPVSTFNDEQDHGDLQQRLLPDMFDKNKQTKEKRISVSGAPILKPGEEGEPLPELDGVKIEIELKAE